MFTGIIEATGVIKHISQEQSNLRFTIESSISNELTIDQSVAHDGVCLTVIKISGSTHEVLAVEETLNRSNLKNRNVGEPINLERCLMANARLDGHFVQGHVDEVATCREIVSKEGSWIYTFKLSSSNSNLVVDKGSAAINGVSLTTINPSKKKFSVAIIPYTFEHTNFKYLKENDEVNIEFDIIGKYIKRLLEKT